MFSNAISLPWILLFCSHCRDFNLLLQFIRLKLRRLLKWVQLRKLYIWVWIVKWHCTLYNSRKKIRIWLQTGSVIEGWQNGWWIKLRAFKNANANFRSCLRCVHEHFCGPALCLHCHWPSTWGESVGEWVYHCPFDSKSSSLYKLI